MWYGPERNRWKQVATASGLTETTLYVGGILEKVTLLGVTSWKHYISGPSGPVAMYTRKSDGTQSTYYFTKDHLGSTDSITDASGTVQVRLSYHAFGKRRKEAGWSGSVTTSEWLAITNTTRRGFTFHEMLDSVGMIHMNGRIYSPTIGRFLSPDPFVPDPLDTQSFNRYSYVLNNPLSLVDPSGFATRNTANDPPDPEARHDAAILAMARAAIANGGQFPSIWDFSSGMAWAQSKALASFRGASGSLQLEPTDFSGRRWRYVRGKESRESTRKVFRMLPCGAAGTGRKCRKGNRRSTGSPSSRCRSMRLSAFPTVDCPEAAVAASRSEPE
ncbi:MAG: hypothetical protein IRZ28_13715 [Steroidobacteraceae bacterium]|nr:hypothetical protein [Steroidobacteraceae bacterium]